MSLLALSCDELLTDFGANHERWRVFFGAHPAALAVPCDVAGSANVAELVWHIFTVSIRHSQRLLGEPVSPFDQERVTDLEPLMALATEATSNLRRFLDDATQQSLDEVIEMTIRSGGTVQSSRRKLYVHLTLHAMRHWAQIATLLRQHDLKPDWPQDFFFSPAML